LIQLFAHEIVKAGHAQIRLLSHLSSHGVCFGCEMNDFVLARKNTVFLINLKGFFLCVLLKKLFLKAIFHLSGNSYLPKECA